MYGDPPTPSQPRRPRDPPSSPPNRRRPREQIVHTNNVTARRVPPRALYSNNGVSSSGASSSSLGRQNYYHQPRHNDPNIAHNNGVGNVDRPTLRRRGSSSDRVDRVMDERPYRSYRENSYNINMNGTLDGSTTGTRRSRHSTTKTTTTANRLSRILTLVIACLLMFWGSSWGFVMGIGFVRGAMNIVFGRSHKQRSTENELDDEVHQFVSGSDDEESEDVQQQSLESNIVGLRGRASDDHDASSSVPESGETSEKTLSIHDLNLKSHLLKAEGRQIINDRPMEVDQEGKGDKSYMGNDSTNDFFFAGGIVETKRIVNAKGRIETISYPAHSYALLPVLVDATAFAISIWVHLSLSDDEFEDNLHPRVIMSTRSKDYQGCHSDVFGERLATGIVLYAQPHYGDNTEEGADGSKTYRIILEYPRSGKKLCRTLIGTNTNSQLVREGNWHHITIFATQTSEEGHERMSLYVDGDLAGRNENELRQTSSYNSKPMTTVGRYSTQDGGSNVHVERLSRNNFDLSGRVGMLSFWETGSPNTRLSTEAKRMNVQSESDEDHVVRAIFRSAFDIRAIRELSLQGLLVKEPTLLYTFDGHKEARKKRNELYSESPRQINELMHGLKGTIMSELIDGMPSHQRRAFIPLGPNRYSEYKDGTFHSPTLKDDERRELNEIARARSGVVKKAMQHAWSGYKKYAFGQDELLPITQRGQDNWGGMGTTLVDSLSTLWIMGMKEEFWEARDWVRDNLDFGKVRAGVSVFETTIRNLGGLLSAYDLSGDKVFLEKADDLGMRLRRAFESRTGVPYGEVELFDGGRAYNIGWHSNEAVLSEIGTLQVEFRYLAKATGKSEYAIDVMRALDEVLKLDAESGLYPTFIQNTRQEVGFGNRDISIGAMGDSFYEYLLKIWLQGGKHETKYRRLYDKSINGIIDKLIHTSKPNYLTYVAELKRDKVIHKMDHLSCFLGGNLALGAYTHPDGLQSSTAQKQLKIGKQLAYTCYQMYARSKSGLSPEFVVFDKAKNDFKKGSSPFFILRPETSETFFILYHLTKDPVYREWGWEIFQAIEEHCKTDAGYAAIQDVDTMKQNDRMESFFLAETLKYLYLLQDDTNDIDLLNTHVFNTEAHPLTVTHKYERLFDDAIE